MYMEMSMMHTYDPPDDRMQRRLVGMEYGSGGHVSTYTRQSPFDPLLRVESAAFRQDEDVLVLG